MKLTFRRLILFLVILGLSVGFGFAFDAAAGALERRQYPMDSRYAALIRENADTHGIPEPILWAMVRTESDFASNAVGADGSIGLMQLAPEDFNRILSEILGEAPSEPGLLYDPETNLHCGSAYLSYLYRRYGVWETVYAAWHAGPSTVDAWLRDPDCVDELGRLQRIPDADTEAFAATVRKAVEMYTSLYFQAH